MEEHNFVKGALIGGAIAGLAALLMAPKSGKDLRDGIADSCHSVDQCSRDFIDSLKERGQCLMNTLNGVEPEPEHSCSSMMSGGAIGAVIGIIAALLLAPQSGAKMREHLGDQYDSLREKAEDTFDSLNKSRKNAQHQVEDWKDALVAIVSKLSAIKKGKASASVGELMDWANIGLRLYHGFQHRR